MAAANETSQPWSARTRESTASVAVAAMAEAALRNCSFGARISTARNASHRGSATSLPSAAGVPRPPPPTASSKGTAAISSARYSSSRPSSARSSDIDGRSISTRTSRSCRSSNRGHNDTEARTSGALATSLPSLVRASTSRTSSATADLPGCQAKLGLVKLTSSGVLRSIAARSAGSTQASDNGSWLKRQSMNPIAAIETTAAIRRATMGRRMALRVSISRLGATAPPVGRVHS